MMKGRKPKFRNVKTVVNGVKFDSKKEAARYGQLRIMERANVISELELQPEFKCIVEGKHVCTYRADFRYIENGESIVEDVKSPATAKSRAYRIKKKLVEALFNIQIKET